MCYECIYALVIKLQCYIINVSTEFSFKPGVPYIIPTHLEELYDERFVHGYVGLPQIQLRAVVMVQYVDDILANLIGLLCDVFHVHGNGGQRLEIAIGLFV